MLQRTAGCAPSCAASPGHFNWSRPRHRAEHCNQAVPCGTVNTLRALDSITPRRRQSSLSVPGVWCSALDPSSNRLLVVGVGLPGGRAPRCDISFARRPSTRPFGRLIVWRIADRANRCRCLSRRELLHGSVSGLPLLVQPNLEHSDHLVRQSQLSLVKRVCEITSVAAASRPKPDP